MLRHVTAVRAGSLLLLGIITGLACHSNAADDPKEAKLDGRYSCVGTTFDGTRYRGTVRIAAEGDSYLLSWRLDAGDAYGGIGILTGDVLSVAWQAGDAPGIVAYKVERQNGKLRLVGKWTVPGIEGRLLEETLTPVL